jgi:hypothetical protein
VNYIGPLAVEAKEAINQALQTIIQALDKGKKKYPRYDLLQNVYWGDGGESGILFILHLKK